MKDPEDPGTIEMPLEETITPGERANEVVFSLYEKWPAGEAHEFAEKVEAAIRAAVEEEREGCIVAALECTAKCPSFCQDGIEAAIRKRGEDD
jgi:hypothetical protein